MIKTILLAVSGILLFSVTFCGLWIRYSGKAAEPGSIDFHMWLGIITVVAVSATFYFLARK
jgi:hypothetical protein